MEALRDAFGSLGLNVACITETWFKEGSDLREHLIEVEGSVHHRSRDGRTRKTGGGVAVAFGTETCNLKVCNLKHAAKDAEVMCVVGVVGKVARRTAIFFVYVTPSTTVPMWDALKEPIAVEFGAVMKAYKNPIMMVTGDFNQRDIGGALNEVGDFAALSSTLAGLGGPAPLTLYIQDYIQEAITEARTGFVDLLLE